MRVPPVPGTLSEDCLCSPRAGGTCWGPDRRHPGTQGGAVPAWGSWHDRPWGWEELTGPKGHFPTRLSHERGDLGPSRPRVRRNPGLRRSCLAQGALAVRGRV